MSKDFKIGYICGCFDLFHIGHLNILERCKENCDYLIVGICDDEYIKNNKHRLSVYSQEDRARLIKSLRCVDDTVVVSAVEILDKLEAWKRIKFDILFNGSDWVGTERSIKAENDFKDLGVEIKYFPYTDGISTSGIIKKIRIGEYR